MIELYGVEHRQLQDEQGTRRLADRLGEMAHVEITADERDFIQSLTMFFLASVDHLGRPTVSYKGGAPGFVRVKDTNDIVFPSYDGNGMYLSLGNVVTSRNVGLLFIDFERPRRLRVQGTAAILREAADCAPYPGAQYVVCVTPEIVFMNCGRYIHGTGSQAVSKHVPDSDGRQPFPNWKKLDVFSDVLSEDDRTMVDTQGGPVPIERYTGE